MSGLAASTCTNKVTKPVLLPALCLFVFLCVSDFLSYLSRTRNIVAPFYVRSQWQPNERDEEIQCWPSGRSVAYLFGHSFLCVPKLKTFDELNDRTRFLYYLISYIFTFSGPHSTLNCRFLIHFSTTISANIALTLTEAAFEEIKSPNLWCLLIYL